MIALDSFALGGRQGDDAELFAAIAEYQRIENIINDRTERSDEETARLCDENRTFRYFVEQYRPATLKGVLAALDFGSEIDDPHYWPEGATEGLRAIIGRQDDAELIQAGERWEQLHRRLQDQPTDDEAERIANEQGKLMVLVNNAEPASLLGCIIKLRALADPEVGMDAGDRDDDVVSVRQVLSFLERMSAEGVSRDPARPPLGRMGADSDQ